MNANNPLVRHAMYYGVALGITLSVFELLALFLGLLNKPTMSFINIAIVTSMIIIALRKYRDQIQNGSLSFGNGFIIGLLICVFSGAIWSLYRYIEYSIAPQLIDDLLLIKEEMLLESKMDEDLIESMMKINTMYYSAPFIAISTFFFNMVLGGSILSLILAGIFKKDGNPLQSA